MKRIAIAVAGLAALAASAQEATPPFEVRIEGQRERLDRAGLEKAQPDWREAIAQFAYKPRKDTSFVAGARETERFDLRDREGYGAVYVPIAGRTVLHLEGSASSTHRVLPKAMGLVEVSQPLADGWVVSLGGREARYDSGRARMAIGTVEKYAGDFRLAYTGYASRAEGSGWAPAHRVAASWYRGPLTFVTLAYARGREVESLPAGLLVTDVRGASLAGGIEVLHGWGLTFELGHVRQGDLYTRRGVRLGTRFVF